MTGLVEALDVRTHVRRGLFVGVVLAVGVFGFFVVVPSLDPGQPVRQESAVLYLALAFVVATSATLLVASALVVRAVAGRVMAYETWVRRGALTGAVGGAWWMGTGALAVGVTTGTLPATVEPIVLGTLPLPVLLLAIGSWAVVARSGSPDTGSVTATASGVSDENDVAPDDALVAGRQATETGAVDHVRARPRRATLGGIVALGGIGTLHVGTFLETATYLGETAPSVVGPVVVGTIALAAGTVALASAVRHSIASPMLTVAAGALAGVAAGFALGSALTGIAMLAPIAATGCLGVAWLALAAAVADAPGTYPDRPL